MKYLNAPVYEAQEINYGSNWENFSKFNHKKALLWDFEAKCFLEGIFILRVKSTDNEFYLNAVNPDAGTIADPLYYGFVLLEEVNVK